jgi:hypothetical protein
MNRHDGKISTTPPAANLAEQEWFSRHLTQVTFDRDSELVGKDFQKMITEDCGMVKGQQPSYFTRNPSANATMDEIVYQVTDNDAIRTFKLQKTIVLMKKILGKIS